VTSNPSRGCDIVDFLEYRATIMLASRIGSVRRGAVSRNERRAAILNVMLDAVIAAARAPSRGDDVAFDAASTNAIVAAIEGARRAVYNARTATALTEPERSGIRVRREESVGLSAQRCERLSP
jgi:hypothetical protein